MKENQRRKKITPCNGTGPARRFSMVELLTVIAILMIVAGMSTVAVAPLMRGRNLRNGSRALQTVLRQARSYAASSRQDTSVRFEYGDEAGLMEVISGGERVLEPRYLPMGIEFDEESLTELGSNGGPLITFTPTGALKDGSANVQINNGGSITITVVGSSGLVRVGDVVEEDQ